ncbi:hypothetical protein E8E11_001503 [Didymella keratinophila]|nr:hypothetical protein E8E11_001503 [Didymella keratinophila]
MPSESPDENRAESNEQARLQPAKDWPAMGAAKPSYVALETGQLLVLSQDGS